MRNDIKDSCVIRSPYRARRLIDEAIGRFELDLTGLVVLTEAASGNYIFTALIAALSGAKQIIGVTKHSRYASVEQVTKVTFLLAECWGVTHAVEICTSLTPDIIGRADIVTNLGFVRPINKEFISDMKETAVVPLMFETWEYRGEDLDLLECRRKGIAVLGTNERAEELEIFGYVGYLAMKLAFELDIEVFKSKVIVVGGGYFGENTVNAFTNAGAKVVNVRLGERDTLSSKKAKKELADCDLIVFVEHESRDLILGEGGQLGVPEMLRINPGISIVHIAGGVDRKAIEQAQIPCRPAQLASPGYMSVTTDYLGPKPVIDLHTAGLKVGELMARARLRGLSREQAEGEALQNPICQGFSEKQKRCSGDM